jgi:serine/threonine-protein kinase
VASALNDISNAALRQGRLDEAQAGFERMIAIYKEVYHGRHYLIATATSNLGGVFTERKNYARAEALLRDAVARFTDTLSANHLNTGIARIKLGRVLLREKRFEEAEKEVRGGYEILRTQASPSITYMRNARQDLSAIYAALHRDAEKKRFERELAGSAEPRQ